MWVLAPRLHTLEGVARPPINMSENVVSAHVCKVTFKHLPQPIRSHTQSFRTLGLLLKIPPFFKLTLSGKGYEFNHWETVSPIVQWSLNMEFC